MKYLFILPIKVYQYTLSPLIVFVNRGPVCRFHPSCSEYAIEAIQTHGVVSGTWLALKRIAKCHPWGPHGPDPVPPKSNS